MAHTPGPWIALPSNIRDNWRASKPIFGEGLWRIMPEANVERCPIAEVDRGDDHDLPTRLSAADDARLMAASPDLLDALDAIMPSPICGESWNLPDSESVQIVTTFGKIRAARAAIAKALPLPTPPETTA